MIPTREQLLKLIPKNKEVIVRFSLWGGNNDIVDTIKNDFATVAIKQAKKYAHLFKGKDTFETLNNIYQHLRMYYEKRLELIGQDVISPNQLIRQGWGNCKHFTMFTNAILYNLGIPCGFRFVSYDSNHQPSHVYNITLDEKKNYCSMMPVLNYLIIRSRMSNLKMI